MIKYFLLPLLLLMPSNDFEITKEPAIIQAEVTRYTPRSQETDNSPSVTASGGKVNQLTAACPDFIKFGTLIEVNGKTYICSDRMAKRYRRGNYFDIISFDLREARAFGRQHLAVKIYQ